MQAVPRADVDGRGRRLWRTILYPTDFGPAAREAWPYALALAKAFEAPLRVLHVVETFPWDASIYPIAPGFPTAAEVLRLNAENRFGRLRAEAEAAGVHLQAEVIMGGVRREIGRVAREAEEALLVMGTHTRSGLGRWLMGDVAGWMARHAPCPVLTIPLGAGSETAQSRREGDRGHAQALSPRAAAA